jgi:hypothetical protein
MLFQSLKDHTRGDLRWEVLEQWEGTWDECKSEYGKLEEMVSAVVKNFLYQEKGLEKNIKQGNQSNQKGDAVLQVVETLCQRIWSGILSNKLESDPNVFGVIAGPNKDVFFVYLIGMGNSNFLTFANRDLAEKVARLGNNAFKNLLPRENEDPIVKSLKVKINRIRRVNEELADMLNPLVLRPIILRTRCDLCPA